MPDPTWEDWYRLLTVALLASESRPFPNVNGVALGQHGLTILVENDYLGFASEIESRFNIVPAIRVIGEILPIAQGGDSVNSGPRSIPGTLACLVKDA